MAWVNRPLRIGSNLDAEVNHCYNNNVTHIFQLSLLQYICALRPFPCHGDPVLPIPPSGIEILWM